jgi:23S rRNA pseudouridine2605 synthase
MGYCSRSHAFDLIRAGRVGLNGGICRNPEAPVRSGRDGIEIDGRALAAEKKVYLMFNKPRGIVTTASDEKGRETVYAYLDDGLPWVAPVGRLDKASEGLLLLTNDSEWAERVLAPGTRLDKTYHVQIGAVAEAHLLESLTQGIKIDDRSFLRVKSAKVLRGGEKNTWLEIVLNEGKNRHIRRMLSSLRINVLRLLRVSIGPLVLGELPKGASRPLRDMEKKELDRVMGPAVGWSRRVIPARKTSRSTRRKISQRASRKH